MNGFRQATMTPHYCYEESIDTHEIPNEPTFGYWVSSNTRYTLIPENAPQHEYNVQLKKLGIPLRAGVPPLKMEYTQEELNAIAEQKRQDEELRL